ncbi:MAG: hypothetical protein CMG06_08135, partial [Candidatus Marinimicrobia bacterium]|nr:hypothetical protein [Candidatus Neomarinimicrobiota bacterium]
STFIFLKGQSKQSQPFFKNPPTSFNFPLKMTDSNESYTHILAKLDQWSGYEFSAQPRDISKLEGIKRLLEDLENPQKNFKIIHEVIYKV